MQHKRFQSGDISTGFIAEEYPDGFTGAPASPSLMSRLAAIAAFIATAHQDRDRRISGQLGGRLRPPSEWRVRQGDLAMEVSISEDAVIVDGQLVDISMSYIPGEKIIIAEFGGDEDNAGEELAVKINNRPCGITLTTRGAAHDFEVLPAHIATHAVHMIEKEPPDLSKYLLCPMPGLLVKLHVEEGEKVEAGQPLAIVEAMKMENILRAEKAATVKTVSAKEGDSLAVDAVILEME